MGKKSIPLAEARKLAEKAVERLAPYCSRIEIAGSIRRLKPTVGDIEIVCIPTLIDLETVDMFGYSIKSTVSRLHGWLGKAQPWPQIKGGDKYIQFDIGPCNLDLFITTPEEWGVIYLLRTGPADWNKKLVTQRCHGGLCPSYLKVKDGRVQHVKGKTKLDTPEEADVFQALGLGYVEPWERVA